MSATAATAGPGNRRGAGPARVLALAGVSIPLGLLVGMLSTSGRGAAVLGLGVVGVFVVLWKKPHLSPAVVLGTMLTIEQFPTDDGPKNGVFTDRIPLFHGLAQSVHINLADLLVIALGVLCLLRSGTGLTARPPRSAVSLSMLAVVVAVVLGLAVGRLHGGSLRTSFTEVRPYAYLAVAYVLAASFASRREALRGVLWAIVIGSSFKAAETLFYFLRVHHQQPRPQAIVGHEEALFFGIFILLTLALWLFDVSGRLRTTATSLLPLVVLADLANGRRTAWLIVGACFIVMVVIASVALPARRRMLLRLVCVLAAVSAVYVPAYWKHTGALALPARTLHSAISPDPRDSSSDLYREQENANLKLNIKEGGILGRGFGVPIDYRLPITNLTGIDPLIAYIPHDGVLYILMRMGLVGGVAFWSLLGTGIIGGARSSRSPDREVACFGALLACALVGYALEGYNDQGFFFYRIAFVMGTLLGVGEAARRIAATPTMSTAHARAPEKPRPASAAPSPRIRRRWVRAPRRWALGAATLAVVPVALLVTGSGASHRGTSHRLAHRLSTTSLPSPRPAAPRHASLSLGAVGTGTWVEVRAGSAHGRILYERRLEAGNRVSFSGSAIWARFGGAGNLDVRANGRRRPLLGTVDVVVSPGSFRIVPDPASSAG